MIDKKLPEERIEESVPVKPAAHRRVQTAEGWKRKQIKLSKGAKAATKR